MSRTPIMIFIDAPDPDNFVLVKAIHSLFPRTQIKIALTGRPVKLKADQSHQTWEWDLRSSRMVQEVSAARLKNFMRNLGMTVVDVFDGGIAPRTLVPHWIHFQDYHKFMDVDALEALHCSELSSQEELAAFMASRPCRVVVGGPMTGLRQVIERHSAVAQNIIEIHAMFATWGTVALMDLGDGPRGATQFNVACDPASANFVLKGLTCPIYLMPTEVTRHAPIGFANIQTLRAALPNTPGVNKLLMLYAIWYDAAVKPRQEKNPDELIYIHDLVSAFSLKAALRKRIYQVEPIVIDAVPHLPHESAEWGVMKMHQARPGETTNVFAATGFRPGGEETYLQSLHDLFR